MASSDMLLIKVLNFDGDQDLRIHVRTTIHWDYSIIESAAIRIGDDTLEVSSYGEYAINDVEDANSNSLRKINALPTLGGYPVYHTEVSKKKHRFEISLGMGQNITIHNMKDIVSINIYAATKESFGNVVGLLGNFNGDLLARDGVTDLSGDANAMGQEWQIREDEPMLFRTVRAPQFPDTCRLPDFAAKEARRLGEGISEEAAKAACAHIKDANDFANCVYDVTATNDLDMATSGAY
jgi:hypothetical protein